MELVDIAGPVHLKLFYREMKAICPITKTRDMYDVELTLISKGQKSIELRSLYSYLQKFHDIEILCENLAYQIMSDLAALKIFSMIRVNLHQYSSEIIELTAVSTYYE